MLLIVIIIYFVDTHSCVKGSSLKNRKFMFNNLFFICFVSVTLTNGSICMGFFFFYSTEVRAQM